MLRLDGARFLDEHGRTRLLRGVNLGSSSRVPATPDGRSFVRDGFFEHRRVSFVGRPFPLEDADAHDARLKRWGLTTMRFLVTWEAIEHEGSGKYDLAYLDSLEAVVRKAAEHGLDVFIDFHQDVWSRFTGGDGAPGWTLEAAGFQLEHLHETGAAFVHCQHDGPLPRMIWPSDAGKLAAATMFTLFFAGDLFAPRRRIDGEFAQPYLRRHFFGAMEALARRFASTGAVFGYDVLNEPSPGYIGWSDLTRPKGPVTLGAPPSPLESMALGAGASLTVKEWTRDVFGARAVGKVTLNPRRPRARRGGAAVPVRAAGHAGGLRLRAEDAALRARLQGRRGRRAGGGVLARAPLPARRRRRGVRRAHRGGRGRPCAALVARGDGRRARAAPGARAATQRPFGLMASCDGARPDTEARRGSVPRGA